MHAADQSDNTDAHFPQTGRLMYAIPHRHQRACLIIWSGLFPLNWADLLLYLRRWLNLVDVYLLRLSRLKMLLVPVISYLVVTCWWCHCVNIQFWSKLLCAILLRKVKLKTLSMCTNELLMKRQRKAHFLDFYGLCLVPTLYIHCCWLIDRLP